MWRLCGATAPRSTWSTCFTRCRSRWTATKCCLCSWRRSLVLAPYIYKIMYLVFSCLSCKAKINDTQNYPSKHKIQVFWHCCYFCLQEKQLRALRLVPSILKLQRLLIQRFQRKLDRGEAMAMSIDDMIRDHERGNVLVLLLLLSCVCLFFVLDSCFKVTIHFANCSGKPMKPIFEWCSIYPFWLQS